MCNRIGRTGRAGAKGISLSFCDNDEKEFIRDIHKLINKQIPLVEDHPYPLFVSKHEKSAINQRTIPAKSLLSTAPLSKRNGLGKTRLSRLSPNGFNNLTLKQDNCFRNG